MHGLDEPTQHLTVADTPRGHKRSSSNTIIVAFLPCLVSHLSCMYVNIFWIFPCGSTLGCTDLPWDERIYPGRYGSTCGSVSAPSSIAASSAALTAPSASPGCISKCAIAMQNNALASWQARLG